jgi:hypothetical protein
MKVRLSLLVFALFSALSAAADAPREVHGSGDLFSAPGVVLAWAVQRGESEATTAVVVRVATDLARYPRLAVTGVDPFSKAEQAILRASASPGIMDVRIPRAQFGDFPRTEFKLYAAAADDTPALVVYYAGVPDTTPEFADAAKLDAHLTARIAQARAIQGKAP